VQWGAAEALCKLFQFGLVQTPAAVDFWDILGLKKNVFRSNYKNDTCII